MDSLQTPMINYKVDYKLARVIKNEAVKIQNQIKSDSVKQLREIVPDIALREDENIEPVEFFKNLLKKQKLQTLTDSLRLNLLSDTAIVFAIINRFKEDSLSEKGLLKLSTLGNELKTDKEKLNQLNLDIAGIFLDQTEQVRSNYIKGDQADDISGEEAELERRRYYNSGNDKYDVYVRMLEVMLELSKYDRYLNNRAAIFLHYFKGFVLRLKIPLTKNPGPLIDSALAEQNTALALEENEALIYNELGVLYQYKNNLTEAENNYIKATELSPAWAIPYSNLSRLFYYKIDYQKALMYADKADSLQKNLQSVSINRGLIHEKQDNLLLAEENYQNAIVNNSRYFFPFERLAYVNMNMADYALADSFFYETSIRKEGYSFLPAEPRVYQDKKGMSIDLNIGCPFKDTIKFKPYDMLALFAWGVAELFETATEGINENGVAPVVKKNNRGAIRHFMQVIAIDKKNPLVYHYLARVYYEQQQWEEAELMFRYAIANYMSEKTFKKYLDSVKKSNAYPYEHSCYENLFSGYYYNQADDFYFLASLYEKWGKTYKAEACYRKIIELFPREFRAYMKLWQKLEKQKLFTEAEMVLLNCEKYYHDTIYNELNSFYRRAIYNEPGKADWYYKLGLLLYNNSWRPLKAESVDNIRWYPRINHELFPNEIFFTSSINDSGQIVYKSTNRKWEDSFIDIGQGTSEKNQTELISSSSFTKTKFTGAIELEELKLASQVEYPKFEGILYLTKAAELISDRETRSSIYFKIGEMYIMAGSKKRAFPEFERSLSLYPDNVNIIIKLAEMYTGLHKNSLALDQLDYLYKSNQISFDKRLQLSRFNILAGNHAAAERLLNKADTIHPYILPEIYNLHGLSNMLANNPNKAIAAYEKSIASQQADPWFNHYSIARMYAKSGNTTQAWKYLNRAVDLGFNYSYVLQNDSYMESLRKTEKWQTRINGITMKKYKQNIPVN
jgi:tetratricopeptide (TPR) repeat protein